MLQRLRNIWHNGSYRLSETKDGVVSVELDWRINRPKQKLATIIQDYNPHDAFKPHD